MRFGSGGSARLRVTPGACLVALIAAASSCAGRSTGSSGGQPHAGAAGASQAGSGAAEAGGEAAGGEAAGGEAAGGEAAGGAGGTGGQSGVSACPPNPPTTGDGCSSSGRSCSWGDHPALPCRIHAVCDGTAHWFVTPPPTECSVLSAGCPALPNGACLDRATCIYDSGPKAGAVCSCARAGELESCAPHPIISGAGCPSIVPNEGAPCALPNGTVCGSIPCTIPDGGLDITCSDGVWISVRDLTCLLVCASPDTPIATPEGERPIADIRVGDLVYSADDNAIRPVPVASVHRQRAEHHHVVRVTLASGRVLEISAPHPTTDGRLFGDLRAGDLLDGQPILTVEVIRYGHEYTYDILPASSTHSYFAAGARIGSTLRDRQLGADE
ncbi:MAG TPA: Hint domain-containing protein [Polyangiaceae bacterium]|nr:Hint domain-containing protein [Polyangiaceae bacterium]